jgi:hypothetical protein
MYACRLYAFLWEMPTRRRALRRFGPKASRCNKELASLKRQYACKMIYCVNALLMVSNAKNVAALAGIARASVGVKPEKNPASPLLA